MTTSPEAVRSRAELLAIAQGLRTSGGAVPSWLGSEFAADGFPARGTSPADPDAYRGHMAAALSLGGLLAAFLVCADMTAEVRFDPPKAARAAAADPDGLEAIAMVQDWRPAGDDKSVLLRLAGAVRNPSYPRAWSAEKTDEDSYLVLFREPAGLAYAFEVNLESEAVQPTPEAVERLTMLRVREEADSQIGLLARAP